jgi:hypothetical protein
MSSLVVELQFMPDVLFNNISPNGRFNKNGYVLSFNQVHEYLNMVHIVNIRPAYQFFFKNMISTDLSFNQLI